MSMVLHVPEFSCRPTRVKDPISICRKRVGLTAGGYGNTKTLHRGCWGGGEGGGGEGGGGEGGGGEGGGGENYLQRICDERWEGGSLQRISDEPGGGAYLMGSLQRISNELGAGKEREVYRGGGVGGGGVHCPKHTTQGFIFS